MAMEGSGCFVAWYDQLPGQEAAHDDWHTHEHMIERVAIPGFRRGRRYRALDGGPRSCVIYEVTAPEVLTSPAYLARLNDPTPRSRQALTTFVAMNRTLCAVLGSHGHGVGGMLLTVRLSGAQAWLDGLLPGLARRPGLCGAHLLRGDPTANTATREQALRGAPDAVSDLVLLVEGYTPEVLAALEAELAGELSGRAAPGWVAGRYRLDFTLEETEAKRIWHPPG